MKIEELGTLSDITGYILGMFHDGTAYRIAQWLPKFIWPEGETTGLEFYFTSIVDEIRDTKKFTILCPHHERIAYESYPLQKAIGLIMVEGQFHFVPTPTGFEMSGYIYNYSRPWEPNYGIEMGVSVNADYSIRWVEIVDNDPAMGSGPHIGRFEPEYGFSATGLSPYKLTDGKLSGYPVLRSGMLLGVGNPGLWRPIAATKYTASSTHLFYYSTTSNAVYVAHDQLIKKIAIRDIVDVKPSPNGRVLMVVTKSQIFFYNTTDWSLIRILEVQMTELRNSLKYGAWSQDGLTFAVMCDDFIQIWDYDSWDFS